MPLAVRRLNLGHRTQPARHQARRVTSSLSRALLVLLQSHAAQLVCGITREQQVRAGQEQPEYKTGEDHNDGHFHSPCQYNHSTDITLRRQKSSSSRGTSGRARKWIPAALTRARLTPECFEIEFTCSPKWRNWQTRYVQGVVRVTSCGFKSHLRHLAWDDRPGAQAPGGRTSPMAVSVIGAHSFRFCDRRRLGGGMV